MKNDANRAGGFRLAKQKGYLPSNATGKLMLSLMLCAFLVLGFALSAFAQQGGAGGGEAPQATGVVAAQGNEALSDTAGEEALLPYELKTYTVSFYDEGVLLASYEVEAGQTSPVPAPPSRQEHAFIGWDTEVADVQEDLTIKALYRQLHKYTMVIYYQFADGSMAAEPYVAEVKEGYSLSEVIISPQVAGYLPDQASVTLNIASAQANSTFTVVYTKQSGTAYAVKHYQETLMLGEYELLDTDILYGETAQNVNASPKNYPGFELVMPLASGTIAADGSLELNVYYQRKTVTLSFETEGGAYVEPLMGRYGEALTPPADPERPGHTFAAWDPEIPVTFPAEDITFIARWTADTEADYIMLYWVENANDDGYSMVGLEVKNGTVGVAPELPDPANPFPDNIPFPNTSSRDKKEYFYEYDQTKTEEANSGVLIDAEKSVFVNVYFDRKEFTVHFIYKGHPTWFHPDNVLYPGVFTPLARKYQIEMGGDTRISEDYGTTYDITNAQNTLIPEAERTVSVTAKYMANISADVPRIRYLGVAGTDPEQPAMIAEFYTSAGWTWSHHMTTSDPITHQPPVMTAYYFVSSWGTYKGEESTVSFYLLNTVHTPSYQYAPMFEPIGGGREDRSDYIAGEPITVTFFNYSSDTSMMTRRFAGFRAPTPDRFYNPWYGGIENAEYQWPDDAKAYYERERYTLGFYDGTTALKEYADDEAIWYEEELVDYYYEPATPADKPGYTFAGWYTDSILQDETTLLDFDRAIMPAQGLMLYAKWAPPTYQITFDLNGGTGSDPAAQNIRLGGYINPPAEPTREGYTFGGWTERNRTVVYNMGYPVNRHLDLVARWTPNVSGTYTVYYLEEGTRKTLSDSKIVSGLATGLATGSAHTETAEGIEGYLPDAVSKSVTINVNPHFNSVVFYYKAFSSVDYSITYESIEGQTLAPSETKATGNCYVTENFKQIDGYYPAENQITLQLSQNEAHNSIVFTYLPNNSALYTTRHYLQDLNGAAYTLAGFEQASGAAGIQVTATLRSYAGFTYAAPKSRSTGIITSDGSLVLELYYDRQTFTVSFVAEAGGSLYGVSTYSGILWGTSFEQATRIPTPEPQTGYSFVGWSPALPAGNQAVTQNATYTALFERDAVVPPGVDTPGPLPNPDSTTPVQIATTPTRLPSVPFTPAPEPTPEPEIELIESAPIPLLGGEGYWALLNLILALVGLAVGLVRAAIALVSRKKNVDEKAADTSQDKRQNQQQSRRARWSALALVMGIASLIVFFITEDMTLLMAVVDKWTILMIVLFLIEAVFFMLSLRRRERRTVMAEA